MIMATPIPPPRIVPPEVGIPHVQRRLPERSPYSVPVLQILKAFAYVLATPARHSLLGWGAYAKWQTLSTHRRLAAETLLPSTEKKLE